MAAIESSLLYLKESMDHYIENPICQRILSKLEQDPHATEEAFVTSLEDQEISYLNALVRKEMRYANQADDQERLTQLNEIYELLY